MSFTTDPTRRFRSFLQAFDSDFDPDNDDVDEAGLEDDEYID